jgi:formylmethanofuran dehydrogenase subunit E
VNIEILSKRCSKCNELRDIRFFNRGKECKDGYRGVCKVCRKNNTDAEKAYYVLHKEEINRRGRMWYRHNKDRHKRLSEKRHLFKKYGITPEKVEQMRLNQSNRCAICKHEFQNKKDRHIDHDHSNGKIRELLCSKCNVGIGMFGDDTSLLSTAIEYLNKWK